MKLTHLIILLVLLIVPSIAAPAIYISYFDDVNPAKDKVFFGVTFSQNTTSEAKQLIDKVKDYTNLLVITAWEFCARNDNGTALSEICDYTANAGLHFIVFFDFISHIIYPWHRDWLDYAKEKWSEKLLGIYLYDEPGGRQIDRGQWGKGEETRKAFENVSCHSDAANAFTTSIYNTWSMQDLRERNIPAFTSDYALYWFDYLAGYDCVFVEFGWNHSRTQHIALGRGAANVQGKDWGVIITWTYNHPPYIENGTRLYEDLVIAYMAGAKYIVIFNYPKINGNEYGILTEEHFTAMKKFWNLINSPKPFVGRVKGQVAYMLPKDYGWGMRNPHDKIWGIWPSDSLSPIIWGNITTLLEKYGLKLDIIYEDPRFNFKNKYAEVYFWNNTYAKQTGERN